MCPQLTFRLRYDPNADPRGLFNNEPPDAAEYYEMVGRFIALWSRVELGLNMFVNLFHHPEHLPDEFRRYPVAFDRKMDLVDYFFTEFIELQPQRQLYESIKSKIRELSVDRHNLTHMTYRDFRPRNGSKALYLKSEHKRQKAVRYYTLKKLTEITALAGWISFTFIVLFDQSQKALLSDEKSKQPTAE